MPRYSHQPLIIEKYNPQWPLLYEKEKEKIKNTLGNNLIKIEHIGSTSVPGLSAKPIIDIAISVRSDEAAIKCLKLLEQIDYEFVDKPDQWYLRKSVSKSSGFHLHMVAGKSRYFSNTLALKRYLLTHPDAVKKYKELKEKLSRQFAGDRNTYRKEKSKFVEDLIKKANKV